MPELRGGRMGKMQTADFEQLAAIRAAVGYLGEKDQAGWWPSSFFVTGAAAFLSPLFPRTQFLAQCRGVTAAASRKHDERIGVGQVYHLFRLPEDIEQGIHRILHDEDAVARTQEIVVDREHALAFLRKGNRAKSSPVPGYLSGDCRYILY